MLNEDVVNEMNDTKSNLEFQKFPKIPRIYKQCTVTEKIDGTNGLIAFDEDGNILVGSRSREIFPRYHHKGYKGSDNYGFAEWAYSFRKPLFDFLGKGYHYGEWAGCGIQRAYDMMEKRFFLFNTKRFCDHYNEKKQELTYTIKGIGLDVVPVLYEGEFYINVVGDCMSVLKLHGSEFGSKSDTFKNPEGIIIWLNGNYYKDTFESKGGKHGQKYN